MFKKISEALIGIAIVSIAVVAIVYLIAGIFHWTIFLPSFSLILDIAAGFICLLWLFFIVSVPWNLYFEAKSLLFEIERSIEEKINVNTERINYVRRMRVITGIIAVGSHIVSAGLIAIITYLNNGRTGYYFAFFYILATLFRPAHQAYMFLLNKLREIRNEIKYPRENVVELRMEFMKLNDRVHFLEKNIKSVESRLQANEQLATTLKADINDTRSNIQQIERSFQDRIHMLSQELERALMKSFDNQDILNGFRAFAKLIKQA